MIKRRRLIWTITALAVIAMVLLAAGVGQVELYPEGRPFTLSELLMWLWQQYMESTRAIDSDALPSGETAVLLVRIVLAIALALLPISIVILIISREMRKKALRELLRLTVFVAAVQALVRARFLDGDALFGGKPEEPATQFDFPQFSETDFMYDQQPARWIIYAVSLGIALLIGYGVARIGWRVVRRQQEEATPLRRLAREAQIAVDALQAEADVNDVVRRCYAEMSRIVREERGLRRGIAVTAREFEMYLSQRGLPTVPVQTLTRLFEAVRYGAKSPGEAERQQAIESLNAIAEACRSAT